MHIVSDEIIAARADWSRKIKRGQVLRLVASLGEKLGARSYVDIPIEINQKYPRGDERRWRALRRILVESLPQ